MSSGLNSKYDHIIKDLLKDSDYDIRPDGDIYTLIQKNGLRGKRWRKAGSVKKGSTKDKPHYMRLGYKGSNLPVHRIIYAKFIGPLNNELIINHKDRDSLNNHKDNLELITQSENIYHYHQYAG